MTDGLCQHVIQKMHTDFFEPFVIVQQLEKARVKGENQSGRFVSIASSARLLRWYGPWGQNVRRVRLSCIYSRLLLVLFMAIMAMFFCCLFVLCWHRMSAYGTRTRKICMMFCWTSSIESISSEFCWHTDTMAGSVVCSCDSHVLYQLLCWHTDTVEGIVVCSCNSHILYQLLTLPCTWFNVSRKHTQEKLCCCCERKMRSGIEYARQGQVIQEALAHALYKNTVKSCIKAVACVQFFNFLVRLLFKCGFYLRAAYMQNPESA